MIAQLPHLAWGRGSMVTMVHQQKKSENQLDRDWVTLIKKAKELGMSKRDIRTFLEHQRTI
ncbi:Anti-repressor SinI [Tenuibacillus multivorans]|uniref:Anti-repressor SinI n=1 Tax=Tenuibacillus multivorans TaxID=237069 RepID=A0A1H0G5I8_9BACI|nr:Anti-repressor SinI [Tenuibacillus multivorans]